MAARGEEVAHLTVSPYPAVLPYLSEETIKVDNCQGTLLIYVSFADMPKTNMSEYAHFPYVSSVHRIRSIWFARLVKRLPVSWLHLLHTLSPKTSSSGCWAVTGNPLLLISRQRLTKYETRKGVP